MRKMLQVSLVLLIVMLGGWFVLAHDEGDGGGDKIDVTGAVVPENPTYYEHVKPILETHCNACHIEGQIAGDIAFTDPEAVIDASSDIAFNASIGYMPPWLPSDLTRPMKHDRSLSQQEIATLIAWDEQGAPTGDPADYVAPVQASFQLADIQPDLTLQLEEPYMPDETAEDDYRCFPFALDIEETRYVTAYEFLPDVNEMAHHGIIYLVGDEARRGIERRNREDGKIGWSCYGDEGLAVNSSMIGTWAPGTLPIRYPEGTGFKVEPGDYLIIQMHYNLIITREPDQTQLKLELSDVGEDITELMTAQLTAPVEIPCPVGVEGTQCERETALDRIENLYGQQLRNFPNGLLRNCNQTLEDYADNTGEDARTYCDQPIFTPLIVYGVFGHMHELGRSFRMELNPDTDDAVMMLDIPNWDFDWQDGYYFEEPLELHNGDIVRMSCHWDNTLSDDPRYVVWGEGTQDEMCFGAAIVSRKR